MRYSLLFGKIIPPLEGENSTALNNLFDIGFIRQTNKGLTMLMPLGWKVIEKILALIRSEFDLLDGQEFQMPFIQPLHFLERFKRDNIFQKELVIFKAKDGQAFILSPAQEDALTQIMKENLVNYNDLPLFLYQTQSKYREVPETQPSGSASHEYLLTESYSLHLSYTSLNNFVPKIFNAYQKIFKKCKIDVLSEEGGSDFSGAEKAFEFIIPAEEGEEKTIQCTHCNYSANKMVAKGIKQTRSETPKTIEKISISPVSSIRKLSQSLKIGLDHIAKSILYKTKNGFTMVIIRADYEVSMDKLRKYLQMPILRETNSAEFKSLGIVSKCFSPLAPIPNTPIIIDVSITNSSNLTMNSNSPTEYYINCNFGLDYESPYVADITLLTKGDLCNQCGYPLTEFNSLKIAKIFKIGDFYSKAFNLQIPDPKGQNVFPHLGTYNIKLKNLFTAIALQNSDSKGLIWPQTVTPYTFHLIGTSESLQVKKELTNIYSNFKNETLWDDRKITAKEKLKDANKIGIPIQIIISDEKLKDNLIEIKIRRTEQIYNISILDFKPFFEEFKKDELFNPQSGH